MQMMQPTATDKRLTKTWPPGQDMVDVARI